MGTQQGRSLERMEDFFQNLPAKSEHQFLPGFSGMLGLL